MEDKTEPSSLPEEKEDREYEGIKTETKGGVKNDEVGFANPGKNLLLLENLNENLKDLETFETIDNINYIEVNEDENENHLNGSRQVDIKFDDNVDFADNHICIDQIIVDDFEVKTDQDEYNVRKQEDEYDGDGRKIFDRKQEDAYESVNENKNEYDFRKQEDYKKDEATGDQSNKLLITGNCLRMRRSDQYLQPSKMSSVPLGNSKNCNFNLKNNMKTSPSTENLRPGKCNRVDLSHVETATGIGQYTTNPLISVLFSQPNLANPRDPGPMDRRNSAAEEGAGPIGRGAASCDPGGPIGGQEEHGGARGGPGSSE